MSKRIKPLSVCPVCKNRMVVQIVSKRIREDWCWLLPHWRRMLASDIGVKPVHRDGRRNA
ncbi:hypothetical protein LCGC14_1447610 [marine sediment metagenome]|uniref:Uncharacterized protein n=1 Tax=marine sediment metagenome TaxID=412755 RepID=A0A0F9LZC2_9ZZZZ